MIRGFFILLTVLGFVILLGWMAGSHGNFSFRSHMTEDWIAFGTPTIGIIGLISTYLK